MECALAGSIGVFLKAPQPGRVKTRLAATIGDQAAAWLYASWVEQIFASLQPQRNNRNLVAFLDGPVCDIEHWRLLADEWIPQSTGDLGARLTAAFMHFGSMDAPVVVIGTDCLDLTVKDFDRAFDQLQKRDVVLGPAADGGYYLVGCRRYFSGLFDDVRWSADNTLADQMRRAHELGLTTALLEERADIDTWEDWCAYCQKTGEPLRPWPVTATTPA